MRNAALSATASANASVRSPPRGRRNLLFARPALGQETAIRFLVNVAILLWCVRQRMSGIVIARNPSGSDGTEAMESCADTAPVETCCLWNSHWMLSAVSGFTCGKQGGVDVRSELVVVDQHADTGI